MKAKRTDVRGRLVDDPFDYRETKAGEVMISRGGRVVLTLAKVTGQYKQGNGR